MPAPIVTAVRGALAAVGVAEDAGPMQAYMKSDLPFHGVKKPAFRVAMKPILDAFVHDDRSTWERDVRALVEQAEFREEWYAALAFLRHRRYRHWRGDAAVLSLVEELARATRWWDVVDELASVTGEALSSDRETVTPTMRAWAVDDDLWIRRISILSQLGARADTDTQLLADCIAPSIESTEFFLRKAIGWALRQHARTDPEWVRRYVAEHDDELSGLSRREALKHLA